jgi:hypothetical protein
MASRSSTLHDWQCGRGLISRESNLVRPSRKCGRGSPPSRKITYPAEASVILATISGLGSITPARNNKTSPVTRMQAIQPRPRRTLLFLISRFATSQRSKARVILTKR